MITLRVSVSRGRYMKRGEFNALFGGTVAALSLQSLTTLAQQPAMPLVGFMSTQSPETAPHFVSAFRQGLKEQGFVEGQNVAVEYRWAYGHYDRLPEFAADLVRRQVSVVR